MSPKPNTTLPPAVRPDVARAKSALLPETIDRINALLLKPWSSYEQRDGRIVDISDVACGPDRLTHEAIVAYYEAAGWKVEKRSHQIDGEWFVFSPTEE